MDCDAFFKEVVTFVIDLLVDKQKAATTAQPVPILPDSAVTTTLQEILATISSDLPEKCLVCCLCTVTYLSIYIQSLVQSVGGSLVGLSLLLM